MRQSLFIYLIPSDSAPKSFYVKALDLEDKEKPTTSLILYKLFAIDDWLIKVFGLWLVNKGTVKLLNLAYYKFIIILY